MKQDSRIQKLKNSSKTYFRDIITVAKAAKLMLTYIYSRAPGVFIVYFFSMVVVALIPFAASWFSSRVIDELINIVGNPGVSPQILYYFVAASIITMLLRALFDNLNTYAEMNMWFTISREINHAVAKKYAYLDLEYYENPETMDLLNKVKENYTFKPQGFTESFIYVMDSLIRLVSAIAILIAFSPLFVLIIVITTLPSIFVNLIYGKRNYGIWDAKGDVKRDYWNSRSYLTSENSLMEIKIFKIRHYLLDRVYKLFYDFQKEQISVENRRSLILAAFSLVSILGYASIYMLLIAAVLALEITIGNFSFYLSTASSLQTSLSSLFRRLSRIFENGLYVRDIFEVLDLPSKIVPGSFVLSQGSKPPTIEFKNVDFVYPGTEKKIFDGLNLRIDPGENIAIVGENGAGKTTLIKLLMRFYDVTSGEILIDGHNIKDLEFDSWYSKVATLFQDFNTYHFDAQTNISVGDPSALENFDRVELAATKSGANDFINEYAHGYSQILNKAFTGGIAPSKGQWQKIALARAFFKDASVLILDEPTSAIDPKAEFEIFDQLFEFAAEKTVVIISHRFSTVRNANRIIVIDSGKIVEQGTHEDLMKIENGKYKIAFELQKRGYE